MVYQLSSTYGPPCLIYYFLLRHTQGGARRFIAIAPEEEIIEEEMPQEFVVSEELQEELGADSPIDFEESATEAPEFDEVSTPLASLLDTDQEAEPEEILPDGTELASSDWTEEVRSPNFVPIAHSKNSEGAIRYPHQGNLGFIRQTRDVSGLYV